MGLLEEWHVSSELLTQSNHTDSLLSAAHEYSSNREYNKAHACFIKSLLFTPHCLRLHQDGRASDTSGRDFGDLQPVETVHFISFVSTNDLAVVALKN